MKSVVRRFLLMVTAVLAVNLSVFSQAPDSVAIKGADSLADWYTKKEIPKRKFKATAFIVPVILAGYGFAAVYDHGALKQLDESTRAELQEDHPLFAAHVDDYIQFAPAAAVYALNIAGIKGTHNLFDASMLYVTSAALVGASTHLVKQGVGRMRPDNSGHDSFPSGHTATAFMAAEFLHQEYKDVNPWLGYAGYVVATATGTLRMYNNKHWFSDVVAGAGFGIASTKLSYLVYPYIKRLFIPGNSRHLNAMPYYGKGTTGVTTGLMLSERF